MLKIARVILPLLLLFAPALSGCGEQPSQKSEGNTREEPVAGAPAPEPMPKKAQEPDASARPDESPEAEQAAKTAAADRARMEQAADDARRQAEEATRGLEQPKKNGDRPRIGAARSSGEVAPPPAAEAPGEGATALPPPPSPAPASPPPAGAAATVDQTYDVVPVFFGTDRTVEPDPKRLKYGSDRGHQLQMGRAMVTVPTAHKVPNIERPWVVEIPYFKVKIYEEAEDTAKHFTLQEISALSKEQMLALVKERLAKSASFKDHALVFVHGFNTSFDDALYRTAQISYDLKFDGAPFVYSWPSGGKVASYTYDRGSAEQAEPHLAEFLNLVVKESGAKSISLIAHSMGNELLLRVLERMRPVAPEGVVISQVILAAPDVDRDKFTNIAREIMNFAKGVTLYAASNDRALGYSARFWGGVPRAGDVPASGPLVVPGVDTIDVTSVSTDSLGLNHSGYAENNTLLNDIKLLIQTGERPPDKRIPILERMTTASGAAYWRYPPKP